MGGKPSLGWLDFLLAQQRLQRRVLARNDLGISRQRVHGKSKRFESGKDVRRTGMHGDMYRLGTGLAVRGAHGGLLEKVLCNSCTLKAYEAMRCRHDSQRPGAAVSCLLLMHGCTATNMHSGVSYVRAHSELEVFQPPCDAGA